MFTFLIALIILGDWMWAGIQTCNLIWFFLVCFYKYEYREAVKYGDFLWGWMTTHTKEAKKKGKRAYLDIDEERGVISIEGETKTE